MPDITAIRHKIRSWEGVEELPHFHKTSFRVKKKIFLTYDENTRQLCARLSAEDQDVFCVMSGGYVYPVPNKWGQQGWTFVDLQDIQPKLCFDLIAAAYHGMRK